MEQKEVLITNLRKDYGIDLEAMLREICRYLSTFNEHKFREAFYFAAKAHDGQFRKENKPYIVHPIETVRLLTSLHADEDTLIAALLHDVPEDTPHTIDEIGKKFGQKVAFLVNGITKLAKVHFRNDMAKRQIESLKKLFIYTAEDPRIILIKLADRLHNMRTLQYIDKQEKRIRIARETLEIFVPIANLLGIEELKTEMEDLCFHTLHPDEYENLADRMRRNKERHAMVLDQTIETIQHEFEKTHLKAVVVGRHKNLYGIYKNIFSQGKRLDEIDDFIALRILVPEREDCYKALGILHTIFKPKPGKFKDYIAVPKINGYQSLHTTVFGLDGTVTEFQIRTNQMHLEAEYGIAARYFNSSKNSVMFEEDKRSRWISRVVELQKMETENKDFIEDLKLDVLQDRIFVFTPQGDAIDLPKDATCIDFAYSIHTQVGNQALKADLNGEIVPMTTALKTGDTLRIITADNPKGPNREWLFFAKTNSAKNKIREYFKRESREVKVRIGRHLLQKVFNRAGLGFIEHISPRKIRQFNQAFPNLGYRSLEDILAGIGDGTLSTLDFINHLYPRRNVVRLGNFSIWNMLKLQPKVSKPTRVSLKIVSDDQVGQLERLLSVASIIGINIIRTQCYLSPVRKNCVCKFLLDVDSFKQLSELFEKLEHVEGVKMVKRLFFQRRVAFIIFSLLTFIVWAAHPFILYFLAKDFMQSQSPLVSTAILYTGIFMLFFLVFSLKRLTQRSFPELRETNTLWFMTFFLGIFALVTLSAEIYFFKLNFNWVLMFGFILLIFSYLTAEYIRHRDIT